MTHTFTLHEDMWFRDLAQSRHDRVIGYRVGGMPGGKTARIANFGGANWNDWRIYRINADNTGSEWTGHYENAEDALAALQQDAA